jgi:hypothetical protein
VAAHNPVGKFSIRMFFIPTLNESGRGDTPLRRACLAIPFPSARLNIESALHSRMV